MDISASQLEVAVLERRRDHRTFRRLTGARLESLLAEARAEGTGTGQTTDAGSASPGPASPGGEASEPESPKTGESSSGK
jgi:proteasome alpha subunit